MNEYVVADTTVVSRLTAASEHSRAYNDVLGDRRLAVSFQTRAELLGAKFVKTRTKRLQALLAVTLRLPQEESTDPWYDRVTEMRRELKRRQQLGSDASDGDAWVISSALEYGLLLLSHDRQQVALGRAVGLKVWTNLDDLRDDNPDLT